MKTAIITALTSGILMTTTGTMEGALILTTGIILLTAEIYHKIRKNNEK